MRKLTVNATQCPTVIHEFWLTVL